MYIRLLARAWFALLGLDSAAFALAALGLASGSTPLTVAGIGMFGATGVAAAVAKAKNRGN